MVRKYIEAAGNLEGIVSPLLLYGGKLDRASLGHFNIARVFGEMAPMQTILV